jgi:hypothetical protein
MITKPDTPPTAPAQVPASTFSITAPQVAGSPDPIYTGGDADPGGRDDVAGTVAGAEAAAMARQSEHASDTYAQGSRIGDLMDLPAATTTGSTGGAYYDPPRDYGA